MSSSTSFCKRTIFYAEFRIRSLAVIGTTLSLGLLLPVGALAQIDNESPADIAAGLPLSTTTLPVDEGNPAGASYTVALKTRPSRTETVTATAGADADAVDDETPSTVIAISSDTQVVAEGGGAYAVTVTAEYDAAADTRAIPVRITVDPGSAEGRRDFEGVEYFVVTISAGQTAASGMFTLEPIDDHVDEDDETIAINGEIIAGPVQDAYPVAGTTVTIMDNDTRGIVVGASALTIEQGGIGSYEIVLTSRPTDRVDIEVLAPEGSGIFVGQDRYVFASHSWDDSKTVRVRVREDAGITSAPVLLTHRVSGGDYEGMAADDVAITIVERVLPTITVEDARGSEALDALEFVISLDFASPRVVAVAYDTLGGSGVGEARHRVDYRGKSGRVEFSPGETEKRVRVRLLDDEWHEGEEAFRFTLSARRTAASRMISRRSTQGES